ncbi:MULTISPECIES: PilW family protein [Vibrio]|uniref:PilW family protein n=1 Tax=Vibrio TaxID=662 RepID=UPI001481E623|nr:type II secretion system protein [Vibrio sp. A8-1]EKO3707451.1 type II secretion system protein [Vibrio metschnikovii]NNN83826.1 type II secretion system protein [Vibrio sp. A8-1]
MARGFTLMEMVIAIILLGIVGLFLGNVAGQAMGIAATSSSREALIQQGRFITERLSREIREAVPNSVIVNNDNTCIEFLPIVNSALYSELPVEGGPFRLLLINKQLTEGQRLVVFPRNAVELLGYPLGAMEEQWARIEAQNFELDETNALTMIDVVISAENGFSLHSPARRVYIYDNPVAFCYENNRIYRYADYQLDRTALQPSELGSRVLMAENLSQASFEAAKPQLQRNGLIKIELTFEDRGEKVEFVHNALIYNTP